MDGTDNIVMKSVLDTVNIMLHVTRGMDTVTQDVLLDGVVLNVIQVLFHLL